jgi:hypothetical protein
MQLSAAGLVLCSTPNGYLRLLVGEVRFTAKEVLLKGSYTALAHAVGQTGTLAAAGVPSFVPGWLPDQGSNLGPAD